MFVLGLGLILGSLGHMKFGLQCIWFMFYFYFVFVLHWARAKWARTAAVMHHDLRRTQQAVFEMDLRPATL